MILILLLLLLDVKGFSFQSMLCQDKYLGGKKGSFPVAHTTHTTHTNINNVMTGEVGVQNYTILGLDFDVFLFVLNSMVFGWRFNNKDNEEPRKKCVFKRQDKAIIDGYRIRQKERQPFFRISIFLCAVSGEKVLDVKGF